MRGIVIGLGETGDPLFKILQGVYAETHGFDPDKGFEYLPMDTDILHICIPFSDRFVDIVKGYQECTMPKYTVIHSTVPIGTTRQIPNAWHSPIRGRHNRMQSDLLIYTKWLGGERNEELSMYFKDAGLKVRVVETPEETEALKLMCLAKYGASIAMAVYCMELAREYGFDWGYLDVLAWDAEYNEGVGDNLQRPLVKLDKWDGKIGGHCVIPNTKVLNSQHPNQIWDEVLKYA